MMNGTMTDNAREHRGRGCLLAAPAQRFVAENPILEVEDLSLWYSEKQALYDISMDIPEKKITAFIGPSGCGKSTLLRCLNRLNDLIDGVRMDGRVLFEGKDIQDPTVDVNILRSRIGMVFQKSNPFPKSIYENIAYGPRIHGISAPSPSSTRSSRRACGARRSGTRSRTGSRTARSALSGGQMQRLCIARAIAVEPEVVLFDEPCSALDPIATAKIEDLMQDLKDDYTLVIVTHNMQQAARASDYTAFYYLGKLIEYNETEQLFTNPTVKETEDYISGRFG